MGRLVPVFGITDTLALSLIFSVCCVVHSFLAPRLSSNVHAAIRLAAQKESRMLVGSILALDRGNVPHPVQLHGLIDVRQNTKAPESYATSCFQATSVQLMLQSMFVVLLSCCIFLLLLHRDGSSSPRKLMSRVRHKQQPNLQIWPYCDTLRDIV